MEDKSKIYGLGFTHSPKKYADGLVNIVDNTLRARASAGDDGISYTPSCGDDTVLGPEHIGKKVER